jgi:hypothetical protein
LRGHLIYAGIGRLESFNGKKVMGSIALMEFNSSTDWLNAIFWVVKPSCSLSLKTPSEAKRS